MTWMKSAGCGVLDLLLDVRCIGCGRSGTSWCFRCLEAVIAPRVWRLEGLSVSTATSYGDIVATCLNAHKERGHLTLARPLGLLLAAAIVQVQPLSDRTILVPCPSTRASVRSRGQDHVRRLACSAARWIRQADGSGPGTFIVKAPLRTRQRPDQVGLTREQRAVNVGHAFWCSEMPSRHPVIIVDDITTSGATLTEAIRALRSGGWKVAGAAVVARAGMGVAQGAARG